jgi:phosphoribosyl 1,2-cyclic phosphodiesterase
MARFVAKFWGVRGSIPSPSPDTVHFGGNTACVEIRCGDELIVLDMGTGLRALGDALGARTVQGSFLLSHYHWDHIQGLPFFGPAYNPGCTFDVYGATRLGRTVRDWLSGQMVAPYFPVPLEVLRARLRWHEVKHGDERAIGPVRVKVRELHHPNGVMAYRLEHEGRSLVYATDHEQGSPASDRAVRELAAGAHVLVYDAMYSEDEYRGVGAPPKIGWGHSTWQTAVAVARAGKVKTLLLFHHEPNRSDASLRQILAQARAQHPDTVAAREGDELEI